MRQLLLSLCIIVVASSFAQEPEEILERGQLLCRLERGSWAGTDEYLASFPDMLDSISGYLSYEAEDHKIITIFFSEVNDYHILARYTFDSLPGQQPLSLDTMNPECTPLERDLITIRQDAVGQIYDNEDSFFSFYENTSLNPIPLISDNERLVYILTGPQVGEIVVLGNDYVLAYNKKNKFLKRQKLHNSIIILDWGGEDPEKKITSTMHSHVVSEYIDVTDVCTLLLYKDFLEWKQHTVLGRKYVSILDMENETLNVISRKVWDMIGQ